MVPGACDNFVGGAVACGGCPRLRDCFGSRAPAPAAFSTQRAFSVESAMTPRRGKDFRTSERTEDLAITHRHAAGIDVHAAVHFVAVAAADVPAGFVNPEAKLPPGVRKFGANTSDLEAMAAWLKECGVTTIAMESTGVYWIPLYELLAGR